MVLARIYLARGSRESAAQALALLNQLVRNSETHEVLNDLAVAHLQLDDYQEAITLLNKALTKSPAYDEARFNLALAEELAGRKEDARRDWERFINQSSDEKWKSEARTRLETMGGTTIR
jgi:tetratricopeptide (TPR) repeat protein